VSGRIAATLPLPRAARGFSDVMALKLLVRSLIAMDGTAAELAGVLLLVLAGGVVDFGLLLQAAMTRHAATGSAAIAVFLALLAPLRGAGIIKPPRVCL
jgi:hypothetical protein